jgi:hypothetical protein
VGALEDVLGDLDVGARSTRRSGAAWRRSVTPSRRSWTRPGGKPKQREAAARPCARGAIFFRRQPSSGAPQEEKQE